MNHRDVLYQMLGVPGTRRRSSTTTRRAAAITSAVYHATGVRVRELPVRIEDLLRA